MTAVSKFCVLCISGGHLPSVHAVPRGTTMAHSAVQQPNWGCECDEEPCICGTAANGPSRLLHSAPASASECKGEAR